MLDTKANSKTPFRVAQRYLMANHAVTMGSPEGMYGILGRLIGLRVWCVDWVSGTG